MILEESYIYCLPSYISIEQRSSELRRGRDVSPRNRKEGGKGHLKERVMFTTISQGTKISEPSFECSLETHLLVSCY